MQRKLYVSVRSKIFIRVTAQVCDLLKFLHRYHTPSKPFVTKMVFSFILSYKQAWKHGDDREAKKSLFITIDS